MKVKKILGFIQVLLFAWMLFFIVPEASSASSVGMGDIGYLESRVIAKDVSLDKVMSTNNSGPQKAYAISIGKNALSPLVTYGTYVYGGEKLTDMIKLAEAEHGKKVVAALNGDFYDTSNGVPTSAMIINGKIATLGTSAGSRPLLGIKADGTVIYGRPSISISLNDGTKDITINHLNNDRKLNETSIFMYTSDYSNSTRNASPGKEVVLDIESGEMKIGSTITAKVSSVNPTNVNIGTNQIVISTATASESKISSLTVGKTVTITIKDNKPQDGWGDVIQAIGYNEVLAENGVLTEVTNTDTAVHPRSAIGLRADGAMVLFQVDGRQPGWSIGLSYKQIAEYLINEQDCLHVFNLDGGGSSTIIARLPGDRDGQILNIPSDGVERSNSNAILFFANEEPDAAKEVAHIHAYPRNLVILEEASTKLEIKATDKNFYPLETPGNLTFEVSGGVGTVDANGIFTAKKGSGKGTITVKSGTITEVIDVTIVDEISNIVLDKTYLSISPGDEVEFNLQVYKDGMPIICSNSSFLWELSSPALGTIKDGIFKSTNQSTAGSIYVSYKNLKVTIPVEVGKQPSMISTFEDVVMGTHWTSTIENPGNGGVGSVTINTDERYVKFGEKSLRIDYDFSKATGTTSVTAYQTGGNYRIEGYPTHIGMWVYGDKGGANIRMQLRDGTGAVQYLPIYPEIVDWEGWKYIEGAIPAGLPTPLQIQYPIRVMSVSGKVKSSGTLYFDNIRMVYGFRNDDVKEPEIKSYSPSDGLTVESKQPTISAVVKDEADSSGIVTGIKKESIRLWLNNELMTNVLFTDNPDGSVAINYTPSALNPLRPGPQIVKLRVEDNYGNITLKNWQFYVQGEYVGVGGVVPEVEEIFAGDVFHYYINANTYKNFEKFTATLNFNNRALQLLSVSKVDSRTTLSSINLGNANNTGKLDLELTGMNNLVQPEDDNIIKLTFGTKEGFTGNSDSNIFFTNVNIFETGYTTPNQFLLPSYEVKVNYRYVLTYLTSTAGRDITFKVTDTKMQPVSGVAFVVEGQDIKLTSVTDDNGLVTFSEFKNLAVGSQFRIVASKSGNTSEKILVTMVASLGSADPKQIVVSPGEDASNSVTISWQTNLDTTESILEYRKVGDEEWRKVTDAEIREIRVVEAQVMREYLAHVVNIKGLTANTEYEYRVGSEAKMSATLKFKTLPASNFSALLLGDPQNSNETGYRITENLVKEALAINPDLRMILMPGDVVDDANMYSQWNALEKVLGQYLSSMIVASAAGNHDVIREYGDPFNYTFKGANNGIDVLGANYYFEAGDALIAIIDTETPSKYEEQAAWLKNIMAKTDKTFKIVILHRSPYAANYNEPHVRDFWPSVFDEAGIDLVLSGHDHVYNSTTMKNGRKVNENYGPTYISLGSAGSKFYNGNNLNNRPWIDFLYDDDNPVFSIMDVQGKTLTIKSYAFVGGKTELFNTIVLDKSAKIANSIEFTNKENLLLKGEQFQFGAALKDADGNKFTGIVKWELSKQIPGISISEDGLLKVDANITENTEVEVIAYFEGVETRHKVIIMASKPLISDILEQMFNKQNEFINKVYK